MFLTHSLYTLLKWGLHKQYCSSNCYSFGQLKKTSFLESDHFHNLNPIFFGRAKSFVKFATRFEKLSLTLSFILSKGENPLCLWFIGYPSPSSSASSQPLTYKKSSPTPCFSQNHIAFPSNIHRRTLKTMATSQLKRTLVTPPGTQYSGVKKLETVSVAELNAYVLTYP